jgi:hypothetical protein
VGPISGIDARGFSSGGPYLSGLTDHLRAINLTPSRMREVALIPGILHAIMIYCLPSMALLAWQLLRARRWEDGGGRPIHIESSSASRYGGVPD